MLFGLIPAKFNNDTVEIDGVDTRKQAIKLILMSCVLYYRRQRRSFAYTVRHSRTF